MYIKLLLHTIAIQIKTLVSWDRLLYAFVKEGSEKPFKRSYITSFVSWSLLIFWPVKNLFRWANKVIIPSNMFGKLWNLLHFLPRHAHWL